MVERDAEIPEAQRLEVGFAATVGDEGDRLSIGRPRGVEIGVLVVREAAQSAAVAIDDVEIREPAVESRKHELLAVGRPPRCLEAAQAHLDAALFGSTLDVEDHQVVAVFPFGGDREEPAIGGERARGVDEPQALVVVVHRRADQAPGYASRFRIGEPQVDEKAALIAEERDALAVRRQRRGEEDAAARAALGQQRLSDPTRPVVVAELRQERRLDRIAPVVGEILEGAAQGPLERGIEPSAGGAL